MVWTKIKQTSSDRLFDKLDTKKGNRAPKARLDIKAGLFMLTGLSCTSAHIRDYLPGYVFIQNVVTLEQPEALCHFDTAMQQSLL